MKIRIAVAVDSSGEWRAQGWSHSDEVGVMAYAMDGVDLDERKLAIAQYWVEAEVEIPAPKVIQATAEKA